MGDYNEDTHKKGSEICGKRRVQQRRQSNDGLASKWEGMEAPSDAPPKRSPIARQGLRRTPCRQSLPKEILWSPTAPDSESL